MNVQAETEAPDARLRVKVNAAWSRSQVKRMLQARKVEPLEQLQVPDESLHDLSVLPRLAGAFDAVNLKLAKLGGPLQALQAARLARALGRADQLHNRIELMHRGGVAPGTGPTGWAWTDGALLLANDP